MVLRRLALGEEFVVDLLIGIQISNVNWQQIVAAIILCLGPGEERHEGRRNVAGLWHRWYCEIHDAQADYSLHNCSFVRFSQGPSKWDHLTPSLCIRF